MKKITSVPLSLQIVLGMFLGIAVGLAFGTQVSFLGEIGKLLVQLIKIVAGPLLFMAIIHSIMKTEMTWGSGGKMIRIALTNATLALVVGLAVSNFLRPGDFLNWQELQKNSPNAVSSTLPAVATQKISFAQSMAGLIPTSWVQPFAENAILSLVFLALLLGFGLRKAAREIGQEHREFEKGMELILRALEKILGWVVLLTPLAVFGIVAKTTAEYGFAPLKGLIWYVIAGLLGLSFQILVIYQGWLKWVVKMPLGRFWKEAREPAIYSIGANSSLASLPLTLKALDRLGVSRSASTLGACVGTNLNNDGIILYEAMAVLFVAQAHGIQLGLWQQVSAAVICLIAAMGIAGVPEAGFISLSIVLSTVGLPL